MADFISAIQILASPLCLVLCLGGCLLGIILGAIPGLSGSLAITILLPMTFSMDSTIAIAMLISIWVGSCSGGFIGAILLGIPGTPSSVATCYDGYAMTKKGEVTRALSIGTVSNFIGTVPSIIIAMIACPVISSFAVKMGPWEYFGLGFMAIAMVIGISKGQLKKGLISAAIGLLLTQVGYSPVSSTPRFMFGSTQLAGGFNMISVVVGLFAGSMIFMDYASGGDAESRQFKGEIGRFFFPAKDFAENIVNVIRSFLIGLGIGFLPGMGSGLSNVMAYALAKSGSKRGDEFGTGVPDGIIAPEVANNASVGGAIIPMISLGIPGDTTTALLLAGLTIHGIEAGPLMQKYEPVFTNMIFVAAIVGAVAALLIEIVGIRVFPQLLKAPYHYLYPAILILCLVGVYSNSQNMFAVYCALGFTALGIWMSYAGIPQTPFILAFVLGTTLEGNFRKAISYAKGDWFAFFTRPVSCIFLVIGIAMIVWPLVKNKIPLPWKAKSE
ncbi:MAG: tripartite tricarboxylate transporter permease [Lachnospiraceae bacterium]|nr:tripartite tricarboxylate transporter permease [Lachnospiraceae bacterium]